MSGREGIPTRSRAGAFGTHMWSRRWIADLESSAGPGIVRHARVDARHGRVTSLDHSGRSVRMTVRGSRPEPFTVEFVFAPLGAADVQSLRSLLREEPGGVVAAVRGEFSDAVAFVMLPAVSGDTRITCDCPDQPGPCRHAVAAALVMVEWWDREPAVLFALRGLGPEELGTSSADDPSGAGETDVVESLWGGDPDLPVVPSPPPAGLQDLLDAPVTRRVAAAATPDPLEQMRVVADLEDALEAFSRYRPRKAPEQG